MVAHRYWTVSILLISGPYIFSNRSNIVISNVRGGLRPRSRTCLDFTLALSFFAISTSFSFGTFDAASSAPSEFSELAESEPSSLAESSSTSGLASGTSAFAFEGLTFAPATSLLLAIVLSGVLDPATFLSAAFFSLPDLSNDKIVGGSCFGSPARMSFEALKMGIQHTLIQDAW